MFGPTRPLAHPRMRSDKRSLVIFLGLVIFGCWCKQTVVASYPLHDNKEAYKGYWTGQHDGVSKSNMPVLYSQWETVRSLVSTRIVEELPPELINLEPWRAVLRRAEKGSRITVVVIGGSMTSGTGCQDYLPKHDYVSIRACSWPGRLQSIMDAKYGAGIVTVHNLGQGMTSTEGLAGAVHERVRSYIDTTEPDVVIWDYSQNDYSNVERWLSDHKRDGGSLTAIANEAKNSLLEALEASIREVLYCDVRGKESPSPPAMMLLLTGSELAAYRTMARQYALPLVSFQSLTRPAGVVFNLTSWAARDSHKSIANRWCSAVYARSAQIDAMTTHDSRVHPPHPVHEFTGRTVAVAWDHLGRNDTSKDARKLQNEAEHTCPAARTTRYLKYTACQNESTTMANTGLNVLKFNEVQGHCDYSTWSLRDDRTQKNTNRTTLLQVALSSNATGRGNGIHRRVLTNQARAVKFARMKTARNTGWVAESFSGGTCLFHLSGRANIGAIRISYLRTYGVGESLGAVEVRLTGANNSLKLFTKWSASFSSIEAAIYNPRFPLGSSSATDRTLSLTLLPQSSGSTTNKAKIMSVQWCEAAAD